jgi:hypothetical protein
MRTRMISVIACLLLGCAGCRTNQPPEHKTIDLSFFKCEKCKSLEGGIYGKGPFKSLHTIQAQNCVHDWQRIDMKEFKSLATERHSVDWSVEIPFWSEEQK